MSFLRINAVSKHLARKPKIKQGLAGPRLVETKIEDQEVQRPAVAKHTISPQGSR